MSKLTPIILDERNNNVIRACFAVQSDNILILLGGSARPKGRLKYDSDTDQWEALPDLPFSVNNGACLTVFEMKGKKIVIWQKGIF